MGVALQTMTNELTHVFLLSVGAFLLAMFLTPIYTFFAYRYRFWKKQRSESTDGKKLKVFAKFQAAKLRRNIPTMAGVIGVISIFIVTFFFNLDRAQTWLPLAALVGGGAVGLIDDVINLRGLGGGAAGLRSPVKFALITLIGVVLGWFFFAKFGVIALLQQQVLLAGFCFTVVGVLLSYLWFNIYPARFFMGDVGSFAYGVSLGVVAMLTDSLLLLPVIGLLFVVEAGSSLIQIASKKIFKRKIFLSAPIHHHLEAIGWPETKVTMRFWVIGCVMAFIGVMLALAGGHIA